MGTEKARVPPSRLMASCPLLLQPTPGMGINRDFALSLPLLSQDRVKGGKEQAARSLGDRRAGWAAMTLCGQEGITLWCWQLPFPFPHGKPQTTPPHQAMPKGQGKLAQSASQGEWEAGMLRLGAAEWCFSLDLQLPSPPLPAPPIPSPVFLQTLFP